MFEPRALALVTVMIWNAVPMPIASMVLPVDAVQAPATGVVNQLDGSCHVRLDRGWLVRKWGRLR